MKFALQTVTAALTVSTASAAWGYWVPPLDEPGVSCDWKRIKIPGHGTYTCLTVGTGICRDNGGYFGKWRFGIDDATMDDVYPDGSRPPPGTGLPRDRCMNSLPDDDTKVTFPMVIDPATIKYPITGPTYLSDDDSDNKMCVNDETGRADRLCTYASTTHICIGENIEPNYKKFSQERPYLFFYNEKTHTFLYQLVCDGAGTEGKLPQLKMVNNEDLAHDKYVSYPVDITKFKKGTTADPKDMNELWKVFVEWNGYKDGGPNGAMSAGELAAFTGVQHDYFCKEYYGGARPAAAGQPGERIQDPAGNGATISCWDNDCSMAFGNDQENIDFRAENRIFTNEQITDIFLGTDGCPVGSSPKKD